MFTSMSNNAIISVTLFIVFLVIDVFDYQISSFLVFFFSPLSHFFFICNSLNRGEIPFLFKKLQLEYLILHTAFILRLFKEKPLQEKRKLKNVFLVNSLKLCVKFIAFSITRHKIISYFKYLNNAKIKYELVIF